MGCVVDAATKLSVLDPQLWWPNGYGAQRLYDATATLAGAGGSASTLDDIRLRFGFRKLELTDNVPLYPAEIRAMQTTGYPYADYGSCPEIATCDAAGWSKGKLPNGRPSRRAGLPPAAPTAPAPGAAGRGFVTPPARWDRRTRRAKGRSLPCRGRISQWVTKRSWAASSPGVAHMGPRRNEYPRNGVSSERGAQVLEGEAIDTAAAVFQQINHPSVVQWGYANEEYVNATPRGRKVWTSTSASCDLSIRAARCTPRTRSPMRNGTGLTIYTPTETSPEPSATCTRPTTGGWAARGRPPAVRAATRREPADRNGARLAVRVG